MTYRTPLQVRTNERTIDLLDRDWLAVASAALPVEKSGRAFILNAYNAIAYMANRGELLR